MKQVLGNLLEIERGILVHQVNCLGVMGGGLAYQIREKWPALFREYQRLCASGDFHPGNVHFFQVGPELHVANLAGQKSIGGMATIYEAYDEALPAIKAEAERLGLPIYFPKGIGCGLAGGDWFVMEPILERYCPDATLVEFQPVAEAAA